MSSAPSFAKYSVSIDPRTLEMSVSLMLSGESVKDGMIVTTPNWVAGDYDFEPYGRDIFCVSATNPETGAAVEVQRQGLSAYRLNGVHDSVRITYTASAYETEYGDALGLVDSNYAVLMGTRYLFCPDNLGQCTVEYENLPDGWSLHHPSGANRVGKSNTWVYPNFEILLDTPVILGKLEVFERNIRDVSFYFAFVDSAVGFHERVDEFLDKLVSAIEAIHDVFGMFPFEDYTFVLSFNPDADWGLEHLTSNLSGLGPDVFVDEEAFSRGVRVCAHELFHAWNVRRLRPAPLGQLSHGLTCGCFTEGLWMAEGFTRYYEFLISTRVRAYSADQFFSSIIGYDQHLSQQPAYERVSSTDSSLSTFLNHSKYPGRVNNSIDYYDKGMLIAFAIDAHLRSSNSGLSLDSAFRDFYLEFFGDGTKVPSDYVGYTTPQVIDFFTTLDPDLGRKIETWLNKPAGLETTKYLSLLGLNVVYENTHAIGLFFAGDGAPTIYGVADNMPAAVGLAPGDIITAVNGFAYSLVALKWVAAAQSPVTLTVMRGHRIIDFTMTPAPQKRIKGLQWSGTPAQAALIRDWLGVAFDPAAGQVLPVDFYENFHGIEEMI
ncbi:hypothetical protein [Pelagimonas varians]|uniref:M61 glycyl aminopeptidase n=1 Tax=Pelagimonas varians TaxID=696760 RepID=A0A238JQG5_9RHOB|nr:hypothetical protein [Pelagimonas varians]PYG34788.1 putative metalloprotease with PDZ domain [Pelagimonas varians]SMX32417.1 M61 glycyl aminopeptidase [Pelagimonas varians]